MVVRYMSIYKYDTSRAIDEVICPRQYGQKTSKET